MSKGFFITGTDTSVGKTFVTALLARLLCADGFDVGVMKPIETGCLDIGNGLLPRDASVLKEAAGVSDPIELICPFRFAKPLSPNIAARLDDTEIDIAKITKSFELLSKAHEIVLVEGAGGLLVPINDTEDMASIAAALALPLIIVVNSKLGAINHTLLTLNAAAARGLLVKGVIINHASPPASNDESRAYNSEELKRICGSIPILGEIPFIEDDGSTPDSEYIDLPLLHAHFR